MVFRQDPLGVAIIRPNDLSDASRHVVRKAVHRLLPESPAAILIDLSHLPDVDKVPVLLQMTLLSLTVEAGQEPSTPLGFCTTNPGVTRDLLQHGPTMLVFASVAEARRALMSPTPGASWLQRSLGSGSGAASAAAACVAEACLTWGFSGEQMTAREVAFHLVWMARGPYGLNLTLSLRTGRQLLINVRNYSTFAKSAPERSVRMALGPSDEARILGRGASGCGRLVTGAGVAWWAMLNGYQPA